MNIPDNVDISNFCQWFLTTTIPGLILVCTVLVIATLTVLGVFPELKEDTQFYYMSIAMMVMTLPA